MMRNDAQAARVAAALCDHLPRLRGLWRSDGPTIDPAKLGPCSSGERVVWEVAWSVWNNWRGKVRLPDLMRLDGDHLERIGELLVAVGKGRAEAIDAWLELHEPRS